MSEDLLVSKHLFGLLPGSSAGAVPTVLVGTIPDLLPANQPIPQSMRTGSKPSYADGFIGWGQ